jgi:hypothetical protein
VVDQRPARLAERGPELERVVAPPRARPIDAPRGVAELGAEAPRLALGVEHGAARIEHGLGALGQAIGAAATLTQQPVRGAEVRRHPIPLVAGRRRERPALLGERGQEHPQHRAAGLVDALDGEKIGDAREASPVGARHAAALEPRHARELGERRGGRGVEVDGAQLTLPRELGRGEEGGERAGRRAPGRQLAERPASTWRASRTLAGRGRARRARGLDVEGIGHHAEPAIERRAPSLGERVEPGELARRRGVELLHQRERRPCPLRAHGATLHTIVHTPPRAAPHASSVARAARPDQPARRQASRN